MPISLVLFGKFGLSESSKSNPLKVLHSKLEYAGKEESFSFVGISNYSIDSAKINSALVLSVPDLDQKLDDLKEFEENIVESISEKIKKRPIFEILSKTYFNYKNELQTIKELVVYKKYVSEKNKSQYKIENNISNLGMNDLQRNENIDKIKEMKDSLQEKNNQ